LDDVCDLVPQFPATIDLYGDFPDGHDVWSIYHSKPYLTRAYFSGGEGDDDSIKLETYPVILYFEDERTWAQSTKLNDIAPLTSRLEAYLKRISLWDWFKKRTYAHLQRGKMPSDLLAVKTALSQAYRLITGVVDVEVRFNVEKDDIEAIYRDLRGERQIALLREFSGGYKNVMFMIAEIACRMAILNPKFGEEAIKKTPGVILIDEVDLRLHPAWQHRILKDLQEIFPMVQFIVTTHAPAVIGSVVSGKIRVLDDHIAYKLGESDKTYGRDVNSILRDIMGAETRQKEVLDRFGELNDALDSEDWDAAMGLVAELENKIGKNDPELTGARVTIELETMGE
jgi:hypothetical protein